MPPEPHPDDLDDLDDLADLADLDPREATRVRRRDHDADAERRDLMRPGMGKVFKQITDSWGREADERGGGTHRPGRARS